MSSLDERRRVALQRLPALPRALFMLHNFYDVEFDRMVDGLCADRHTITACLTDARATIHAHVSFSKPHRFAPTGAAPSITKLEARLQKDYRQSLEAAFSRSGYGGKVAWPDPPLDITADEKAAATFIVASLPNTLRKAVARSWRTDVATADLWRFVWPWRSRLRERLLRVTDALHCAGWQPFDEWLAGRIAPHRHYPHGYERHRRRRRPLPEESSRTALEVNGDVITDKVEIPLRLAGEPRLAQDVWLLFHRYGRPVDEIARRLRISHGGVRRRLSRANYAILGSPRPSLASRIRFEALVRRLKLQQRWQIIRSAFHD